MANLGLDARTPATYMDSCAESIDEIIKALAKRVQTRGQANYCVCRILLEGMKPEAGWTYRSLSDVVLAAEMAIDIVYIVYRTSDFAEFYVLNSVSILADAAVEIERRLMGPYEDTAILKNGDMACFNEGFAYKPLAFDLPGRRCGCVCDPCQCESRDIDGLLPPVSNLFTQAQWDALDQERQNHERAE